MRRRPARIKPVLDTQSDGRVDVQGVDVGLPHPSDFLGLRAGPEFSAHRASVEADRELLPHFTIVVGHDVLGVGVETHDVLDDNLDPGLLFDLAHDRIRDALAYIVATARNRPQVIVCPVDHEQVMRRR